MHKGLRNGGQFAALVMSAMLLPGVQSATAQDPVYSQFYSAPLQLNPGLAGLHNAPAFTVNYRNQWPALNNAYQTYAVGYDQFFTDFNSGLGLYVQTDDAGDGILKTHKISGIYAYRVQVDRNWQLRLGIEAGVVQSRLNWNKLVFEDQIDAIDGPISPGGTPFPTDEVQPESFNQTYLDIGTGFVLYNERFYLGTTLRHLNTPGLSFLGINQNLHGGIPLRWGVHTGAEFPLRIGNNRNWMPFISPGMMFVSQGASRQINVGTFLGLGEFYGGAWYRHANMNPDAIIAAIGFRSGNVRITYSHDITISTLSHRSGGSHEVGIAFNFDDGRRESIYNDCFSLFR